MQERRTVRDRGDRGTGGEQDLKVRRGFSRISAPFCRPKLYLVRYFRERCC
jgi:hypothetical protein